MFVIKPICTYNIVVKLIVASIIFKMAAEAPPQLRHFVFSQTDDTLKYKKKNYLLNWIFSSESFEFWIPTD